MAKQFGATWWGDKWLDSLTHIDYGNRLPRGARYARNGSVKSIDINGGEVKARVAGSRPTPYKETITIPQFDKKKSSKFVDRITERPLILASLMQRRLDPEVLAIADECGLKVFPSSWKDLGMHCSCPDWAVPCKHLAAVIYKLSEEIDNDPFLVFRLHGLDLLKALSRRGFSAQSIAKAVSPQQAEELLKKEKKPSSSIEWGKATVDCTKLPDIGDDLLELLPANPPFSIGGDFKKTYAKQIVAIRKKYTRLLSSLNSDEQTLEPFPAGADTSYSTTVSNLTVTVTGQEDGAAKIKTADFTARLADVNPASYATNLPWLTAMHRMWIFAANLLSKGLVVPHIVSTGKKYRVLWFPARLHPMIDEAAASVAANVPAVVAHGASVLTNSGEWLLANMLTAMAAAAGKEGSNDDLYDLFFLDLPQAFDAIGQKGVPGGIKVWTDKLARSSSDTGISMVVTESGTGFAVDFHINVADGKPSLDKRVPFSDFMDNPEYRDMQMEVLTRLSYISDQLPELRPYIHKGGKKHIRFDSREFVPFLFRAIPLIRLLGVEVALPKSLRDIITPKVTVKIDFKSGQDDGKTFIRLDELLTFNWTIALGDNFVTPEEFDEIMQRAGELVKFKGRYIYATADDLEKIRKQLEKGDRLSSAQILAAAVAGSYKDTPVLLTEACRSLLKKFREMEPVAMPDGLQAQMRPYQIRGYEWMVHNMQLGFGSIIADDMGLGKTLQVIAVLLRMKETGMLKKRKALVVAPTGLLTNWHKECTRFAPGLSVDIYHGASRDLKKFDADIMLTSYGIARSDAAKLKKMKWETIVIDEAQNIKNTSAAQTKAVCSLPAKTHIAMSGTPVENRLSEYWSIMNFANKGYLGSLKDFNAQYGRPIQMEGSEEAALRFKTLTAPFMMRRLKSDKSIISDLPDKTERNQYASLTADQSALYRQTLDEAMREIEGENGDDRASLFRREGLVLQMIMALKQICNHPAQFLKTGQADADLSGKASMLVDLVEGIVEAGEKTLVFTQFKEMGDIIGKILGKAGIQSMFLHGGVPLKKRNEMVERFQSNPSAQVFILSLKAAGTGLNLTAATNVIHYDLWWNPAVEAQATDRAYRIGQNRNVQVYRFITKGTFEEKIDQMISDKKQLAELTVGTGETWIAKMSDSELRSIFTLE